MSALPAHESRDAPELSLSGRHERAVCPGPRTPLDEEHFEQLRQLNRLSRPALRAAGYAKFSGWTMLLGGALSMPFALGNLPMLVFCVCLAGIGTRELTLRRRLLLLETTSPRKLAINQLALGGTLIAYSVYKLMFAPSLTMVESAMSSDPLLQSTPELSGMMDDLVRMEQLAHAMLYAGLIIIAVVVQGGTAIYYATRSRSLRRLHKRCPAWAVRVHQTLHSA